jgi:hypothetical protein
LCLRSGPSRLDRLGPPFLPAELWRAKSRKPKYDALGGASVPIPFHDKAAGARSPFRLRAVRR